ncbi:MAG TPA: hypothetical protein VMU08_00650 [Rhizomicrobium sp.]|nr:hypothetical protein [Rhizomicrobium sp.]
MDEGQRSGAIRYATSIAVLFVILAVAGFGTLTLLPRQSDLSTGAPLTAKELAAAYARVQPGATRASQLARLGFDTSTPSAQVLSYLGVLERFLPRDSTKFDRLNVALRSCIEAQDRCTALVFTPGDGRAHHGGMFAALGFGAASAAGRPAQVTLLVQDGRVAYKMMTGMTPQPVRTAREAAPVPAVRRAEPDAAPVAFRIVN